jgi:hypothetical protein
MQAENIGEILLAKMSRDGRRIVEELVPEWVAYFAAKNAGYGDMHQDLGVRAQYVDLHRKTRKLKRAFWDNEDIGDETPREVAMDLIGHCFLAICLIDQEAAKAKGVEPIQIRVDAAYGRTPTNLDRTDL